MENNILFLIPTGGGGAEKVSVNIVKLLHRNGYDVSVLFIESSSMNVCQYLPSDIPFSFVPKSSRIVRYLRVIRAVLKSKPSIVFSSFTAYSFLLIIIGLFKRRMKIITRQCFTPGTSSPIVEAVISLFFNCAYINIAQTEEMRQAMLLKYRLRSDKVVALHNPIDTEDIRMKLESSLSPFKDDDRIHFLAIGRISPAKDYITLIKAFFLVREKMPNAHLTIIGHPDDGDYYPSVINEIEELNIQDNVDFLKYTNNPYVYMRYADCFVLSSITEGLPNVLLEALYLDTPCVATRSIPFVSQVVLDGVNGFTVEVGDVCALSEAMVDAVALKGKISNQSSNAFVEQEYIKLFSVC